MNNEVDYLSEILELINKVEENNKAIKTLKDEDTRKIFFRMLISSLQMYYLGLNSIFIAKTIGLVNPNLSEVEKTHVKNFTELSKELKLDSGNIGISAKTPDKNFITIYNDILRMNLINDCWVCFESTLREIFYVRECTKYKNRIWEIYTNEVFNSKDINITEDNKKFLGFLGNCRNAMHNNSFHDPKNEIDKYNNWEYTLNGKNFKLEKGKKIEFMNKETILKIIEKLSDVALDMWNNLNYPYFIPKRYNSI